MSGCRTQQELVNADDELDFGGTAARRSLGFPHPILTPRSCGFLAPSEQGWDPVLCCPRCS